MQKVKAVSRTILMLSALPLLASCGEYIGFKLASAGLYAASQGVFSDPEVNLKEKNYAAADFLFVQFSARAKTYDLIRALPLEEIDHKGVTSPLGHKISEGIALRFAELGYSVDLNNVANDGNYDLYPAVDRAEKYTLKGTYSVHSRQVDVYLRIIELATNQVVGQFDYTMPQSKELRDLAMTETRIFKIE